MAWGGDAYVVARIVCVGAAGLGYGGLHVGGGIMAMLTAREREVAALLAQGYNQREIAAKLGIAYCTVTMHVGNAREKAGARSALDLAVKVASNQ